MKININYEGVGNKSIEIRQKNVTDGNCFQSHNFFYSIDNLITYIIII